MYSFNATFGCEKKTTWIRRVKYAKLTEKY